MAVERDMPPRCSFCALLAQKCPPPLALSVKKINTVTVWCAMEKEIDQNKG
jgi:hypothetical protein